ncbi:DUF2188 domain-containing protein [Micromonospora sp. NBC_01796]|uniref:DUF2188 domain-containing protein n=1 Tax=Micromonospora sp. NBC_01796 TaxID=2975987 RepID=UPI002DDBF903|nr:DUF2188 domain-containing protein [Micromonospora sp. NBC_01796]WSA84519.1 DUF2188 domain-containing protein [Micromonospora sp. NBC_01796]
MSRSEYHVVPDGSRWKVEQGSSGFGTFATKQEAVDKGRETARANQPSQLVLHTTDGKIETEYTYQDDPYPPKG